MSFLKMVRAALASGSVLILAACQTTPDTGSTANQSQSATTPETEVSTQVTPSEAEEEQGTPVAVFLADTERQDGWHQIDIQDGSLFLHPEPIIERHDLTGVQAGSNQQGEGLLALQLSAQGQQRVNEATQQFPNKRLALIVGQTLLAAPGYSTPVTTEHLVFAVGSEENATTAARAIAGVADDTPLEQE